MHLKQKTWEWSQRGYHLTLEWTTQLLWCNNSMYVLHVPLLYHSWPQFSHAYILSHKYYYHTYACTERLGSLGTRLYSYYILKDPPPPTGCLMIITLLCWNSTLFFSLMFILLVHSQTRQPTLLKYDVGTLYSNVSFLWLTVLLLNCYLVYCI